MVLILGILLVGIACALTLKAAVGVGAWEALAQTTYEISGIEVGTCEMLFNCICVVIQIIILRRNFKVIQLLQLPLNILLGVVINIVLYDMLGSITIDSYWINISLLIIGYSCCAVVVGAIMVLDIVTFSLEEACRAIATLIGKKFHIVRQVTDIVLIIVCLFIAFLLDLPLAIREGTIIGMIIFGPIMGASMKLWKPIFEKYDLIDSK